MKNRKNLILAVLIGMALAIILVSVFFAGVFWGRHSSGFYRRGLERHGLLGEISTLGEKTMVIKESNGELKTIFIDNQTRFRKDRDNINFKDLKVSDKIIILGQPQKEEGEVLAKLIRIL